MSAAVFGVLRDAPTNIVQPPNTFVGRDDEVSSLIRALDGGARLLTIHGPPGVGKTRVAQHFELEVAERFGAGGVWMVDLVSQRSAQELLQTCAETLEITLDAKGSVAKQSDGFAEVLSGRGPVLIGLDNFEQLPSDAEQMLARWLERTAEAVFVVTSRRALSLPEVAVVELYPLAPPEPGFAAPINTNDALFLLVDRIQAVRPSYLVSAEDMEPLTDICRMLDGLPLAIELAAARTSVLSVSQLRDRLHKRFELLTRGHPESLRPELTLETALDWSWSSLSVQQQSALAQLSVFQGPFSLEAAESIVSLDGNTVLDAVQTLLDKSLVTRRLGVDQSSPFRFLLLQSVASYARRQLDERAFDGVAARHARYFAAQALIWSDEADGPGAATALRAMSESQVSVWQTVTRSRGSADAQRLIQAYDTLLALEPLYFPLGRHQSFLTELERLLSAVDGCSDMPDRERRVARGLIVKARTIRGMHQLERALACMTSALPFIASLTDDILEGFARLELGGIHWTMGHYDDAVDCWEQAKQSFAPDSPLGVARATLYTAVARHDRGDLADVERTYNECLSAFTDLGALRYKWLAESNLGRLHAQQGQPGLALQAFEAALDSAERLDNLRAMSTVLGLLAGAALHSCQLKAARTYFNRALALYRYLGHRRLETFAYGSLAELHLDLDQRNETINYALKAIDLHRGYKHSKYEALALATLSARQWRDGKISDAETSLRRAVTLLETAGAGDIRSSTRIGAALSAVLHEQGQFEESQALMERSLSFSEQLADPVIHATVSLYEAWQYLEAKNGQADLPRRRLQAVLSASDGGDPLVRRSLYVRVAARQLERALPPDQVISLWTHLLDPTASGLVINRDVTGFRAPGGSWAELSTRIPLSRILRALVQERVRTKSPGLSLEELVAFGWPDEKMSPTAGKNRVYTAVSTLRKMGLQDILTRVGGRYQLSLNVSLLHVPGRI